MADSGKKGSLTDHKIAQLATKLAPEDMINIAALYLKLKDAIIKTIKYEHPGGESFKKELLRRWRNKNPGEDQVKVSTFRITQIITRQL